jgi:hypothetical protein
MDLETEMRSSRFPYTFCCDFIRTLGGWYKGGTKLSRSDASLIRSKIAEILELDDREVAEKIAIYYLKNREEITEQSVREFMAVGQND